MRKKIKNRIIIGVSTTLIIWLIGAFLLLDLGWIITKFQIAVEGDIINRFHLLCWVALKILVDYILFSSYKEYRKDKKKN